MIGMRERINRLESSNLESFRKKIIGIEGKCSEHYFQQIFKLFDKRLRPEKRYTFHVYDGVNNLFNLVYEFQE
jgi:CRISPR/Cas system-associated endonuclease Cas1